MIEDVPGVGKTTLARALARSIGGTFHRLQFTSDLLPSDVLGVSVLDPKTGEFEFKPGPIFANLLLADEINRTPPRTQSALLEAMNDGQVSVDGRCYPLEAPFLVMATQNSEEHYGTYPLPESQMDRFLLRLRIDYPAPEDERRILLEAPGRPEEELARLAAVLTIADVRRLQEAAERVHFSAELADYVVAVARETRRSPHLAVGVSPARRAGLAKRRARRGAGRGARLRAARRPQVAGWSRAGPSGHPRVAPGRRTPFAPRSGTRAGRNPRSPPRARVSRRA